MKHPTGDRLKELANVLFEGNISEMARAIGMTPQSFNKYVQGDSLPGGVVLMRLTEIGVNLNWLFEGVKPIFYSQINEDPALTSLESQDINQLGLRIKWVRLYHRKTLKEFSRECDVSTTKQLKIEQSEEQPTPEYLSRLSESFPNVSESWLIENKPPKLKSVLNEPRKEYMESIPAADLSAAESQILDEVKQFSDFLRNRPLRPAVKRVLLERLIESIDQALEHPQYDAPQSDPE